MVLLRAAMTASLGALLGCLVGWLINRFTGVRVATPIDFTVAVGVLGWLVAIVSAVPPTLMAVRRDPVAVMRTP